MTGIVYLVGAGPGDPGLITVKGLACLRQADIVVFDHLADARLVAEASPHAERISVPWQPDRQERINQILLEYARAGKTVVRLKGGDPFVFGRGGEETLFLAEHGIPFEIVPGVTAAVAVPAYAGIPLTHRGLASTIAIVTGHEDPAKPNSHIDWQALAAGIGTLVFYMGAKNLPSIVEHLIAHGKPAGTPVALIQWGTKPSQRTLVGTLADIVPRAQQAAFKPPVLIIVGDVVRLREQLNWFETKPLFGLRVLVTRSREQAGDLSGWLAAAGAEPVEVPLIRITDPDDWMPLDHVIDQLNTYDWLVFTSVNGVEKFFDRLFASGRDVRALSGLKIGVVGTATVERMRTYGTVADYHPVRFDADALVEGLGQSYTMRGARVLFPSADIARETVVTGLRALGAEVMPVVAYRTVSETTLPPAIMTMLEQGEIHVITFASPSTVKAFMHVIGESRALDLLSRVVVACMGPVTQQAAENAGMRVGIVPAEATIPALVHAIEEHYHASHRHRP
ncbi:MAG: uroporphyrinogen-III C-methyltransferase [Candidatus Latescibacteria bacterium]|nr:uroporphyrinogen-III C-methyltransferase [Candidatus Latescibacterota bacterium]